MRVWSLQEKRHPLSVCRNLSFSLLHSLACLDVVHHLQVEVVFGALQDQRAAHVGRGVVKVKDHVVGVWGSFGPEHLVDLLRPLHLVRQVVSFRGTSGHNSRLDPCKLFNFYDCHHANQTSKLSINLFIISQGTWLINELVINKRQFILKTLVSKLQMLRVQIWFIITLEHSKNTLDMFPLT